MASALQNRRRHRRGKKSKNNPRALRSGPMTEKQARAAQKKIDKRLAEAKRVQKKIDAAVAQAAKRGVKLLKAQHALDQKEANKLAKAAVAEYKKAHKGGKPKKMSGGGKVRGGKNSDGRGGAISGPGTGTSDSVRALNRDNGDPILLSDGEYILPADTVRKVGERALDDLVEKRG